MRVFRWSFLAPAPILREVQHCWLCALDVPSSAVFSCAPAKDVIDCVFSQEIPVRRTGNLQQDIVENTRVFTHVIESYVRRYPDHWFWLHRRWQAAVGLVRGYCYMLVHSDRSHRIQQILERVIVGALFVYVVCSVISISAMQTAYILALVAWAIRVYLQGDTRQLRLPLLMPFSAFLLASVLATILAVEPFESLIELRNVFEALVFYLIVNQVTTEERATTLVRVLVATTTIMALYGLSQSFTYGINFRVRGTMDSKMTFAGLLMLVDLMAVAQVLFRTHRRQLVWMIPALLLITAALLMTQTRSAWCGLIAGCCVIFGLHKKVLLLAVPLGALVVLLLVPQTIKIRALSIVDQTGHYRPGAPLHVVQWRTHHP